MTLQCRQCNRLNPAEAAFCFFDGVALANGTTAGGAASIDFSTWAFPQPFVFPSGEKCHNFLQLALACHRNPQETIDVLRRGFLEGFFGAMGRVDLAMAASAAAKAPDPDRGLDDLLEKLPGSPLGPAELTLEPTEKDLGVLQIGQDRQFELRLKNKGERLVYGKVSVEDCRWIVLGTGGGTPEKVFQFFDQAVIPVTVVGSRLRAYAQPLKVELMVESNGGNFVVPIDAKVPVKPFPEGVLSGAMSPRQLAEKAKAHPKEAAALLENGAVSRWYATNGWTYPVQGPTASGIAAVQQFFEVLGLVKPPKVDVSEAAITLRGKPGEHLEYVLTVLTQEKRAAVAHAVSDQPWLTIGRTVFRGQMATIPLVIESVPDGLGPTVTANLKVTANGNQRFDVPVTLMVEGGQLAAGTGRPQTPASLPSLDEAIAALPSAPAGVELVPLPDQPVAVQAEAAPFVFTPTAAPQPEAAPPASVTAVPTPSGGKTLAIRLLPVGIIVLGLLTAAFRDMLFREPQDEPLPGIDYEHPVVALQFHDAALPNDFVPAASMTFGLGMPDAKDKSKFHTKLIYDEYGRTCNVCVRIDRSIEYLLGREQGSWKPPARGSLGKDRDGHELIGARSVWVRRGGPPISVTQIVEIVPGGLSPDGKKRLLDTCQVRYDITNDDSKPHTVALRFLLDTFIGGNDAVPFTIAGAKEMCDTEKSFGRSSEQPVPDYISALEKQDLKNPGTVAHLSLKYGGGLEPPGRVTLGAWPAASLRKEPGGEKAEMQNTRWEVPVLPMALAKSAENPNGDSCVTMYWDDKEVKPKESRTIGFAYGLGSMTGEKGEGQLGITAGGELAANKEFTLTAYVKNPAPGTTITLTLPRGLELKSGNAKETVPPVPPGSSSPYSPVTWRIRATRGGVLRVKVALSSGVEVQHRLVIKQAEIFK